MCIDDWRRLNMFKVSLIKFLFFNRARIVGTEELFVFRCGGIASSLW